MEYCYTKLTSSSYLTSNVVSVRVGNSEIYLLHSAPLVSKSDYFSKSLGKSFEGAEQRRIDLPDERPGLFGP